MEEDRKKSRRDDNNNKNRKRALAGCRVDAGVMPRARKYKGTEGRNAGHCCCSGWEYKTEKKEKELERDFMFANPCEFLYLPACLWTLHLLGICVAEKRVLTLFTMRGDGCLPSVAALFVSSGHVYESQIIRSELRWARAHRNWLYQSVMWPTIPTLLLWRVTSQNLRGDGGAFVLAALYHFGMFFLPKTKEKQAQREIKNNADRPGDSVV